MESGDYMSLSDTMTALMDKARANYHITDKLSIANLTDLMNQPAVNSPLSITFSNWTEISGWGSNSYAIVPVFENVPVYATVEIKDIASTKSDQGPELMCNYMDKNMTKLSYWDVDSDGNYKPADDSIGLVGDSFSNKNGLRSGQKVLGDSNIRNVAYLAISVGNNVSITYSIRNLVVSYYKPYSVPEIS